MGSSYLGTLNSSHQVGTYLSTSAYRHSTFSNSYYGQSLLAFIKGELLLLCLSSGCHPLSPQKLCVYICSLSYIISFFLSTELFSLACKHVLVSLKINKLLCPTFLPIVSPLFLLTTKHLEKMPSITVFILFINIYYWHFDVLASFYSATFFFFADILQNKSQLAYLFVHKYFNMYLSFKNNCNANNHT